MCCVHWALSSVHIIWDCVFCATVALAVLCLGLNGVLQAHTGGAWWSHSCRHYVIKHPPPLPPFSAKVQLLRNQLWETFQKLKSLQTYKSMMSKLRLGASACTDQKVKTTKDSLIFSIHTHKTVVAFHLTKYRAFLGKSIFSTQTDHCGMNGAKELLICYCASSKQLVHLCVFQNNFCGITLFRQCRQCFESGVGKMERNGK